MREFDRPAPFIPGALDRLKADGIARSIVAFGNCIDCGSVQDLRGRHCDLCGYQLPPLPYFGSLDLRYHFPEVDG